MTHNPDCRLDTDHAGGCDDGEVHETSSHDLSAPCSPTTAEPYTHVLMDYPDGTRTMFEIVDAEFVYAHRELLAAVRERRMPYIIIHPLDADGAEYHFVGSVTGLIRITAAHAERLRAERQAKEERDRARSDLLAGPIGRRR